MQPPGLSFERMERRHIEQVHAIEQASFGEPWSQQLFIRELDAPQAMNLVAVLPAPEGAEVAGYLCASVLAGECSLHKIACRHACRRMGLGTGLLHECLRRARLLGAGEVVLEVREHNAAACALYAHNGFTQTGLRKGYYGDTRENARIMVRRLSEPEYAEGLQHA